MMKFSHLRWLIKIIGRQLCRLQKKIKKYVANIVLELLEQMKSPSYHLETIVNDFDELSIEYCVISGLAVRMHN